MPDRLICVFAGARPARRAEHARAAKEVVRAVAARGLGIVYGGGGIGMMGEVAQTARAMDVQVLGVIPRFLVEREALPEGLGDVVMVDSMAERKEIMFDRASAFLAVPGGIGTYDELFEAMSANYLGLLDKPCGVLNAGGYFDPLVDLLDAGVRDGFIGRGARDALLVERDAARLVDRLVPERP